MEFMDKINQTIPKYTTIPKTNNPKDNPTIKEERISEYVNVSLRTIETKKETRIEGCFSWLKQRIQGNKVAISEGGLAEETITFSKETLHTNQKTRILTTLFPPKVAVSDIETETSDSSASHVTEKLQSLKEAITTSSPSKKALPLKDILTLVSELQEIKNEIEPTDLWAQRLYKECKQTIDSLKLPIKIRGQLTTSQVDEQIALTSRVLEERNPRIHFLSTIAKNAKESCNDLKNVIGKGQESISEIKIKKGNREKAMLGDESRLESSTYRLTPSQAESLQQSVNRRKDQLKDMEFDLTVEHKKLDSIFKNHNTDIISNFKDLSLEEVDSLLEMTQTLESDITASFKSLAFSKKRGEIDSPNYEKQRKSHIELQEAYRELSSILTTCKEGRIVTETDRKGNTVLFINLDGQRSPLKISGNPKLGEETFSLFKALLEKKIEETLAL